MFEPPQNKILYAPDCMADCTHFLIWHSNTSCNLKKHRNLNTLELEANWHKWRRLYFNKKIQQACVYTQVFFVVNLRTNSLKIEWRLHFRLDSVRGEKFAGDGRQTGLRQTGERTGTAEHNSINKWISTQYKWISTRVRENTKEGSCFRMGNRASFISWNWKCGSL